MFGLPIVSHRRRTIAVRNLSCRPCARVFTVTDRGGVLARSSRLRGGAGGVRCRCYFFLIRSSFFSQLRSAFFSRMWPPFQSALVLYPCRLRGMTMIVVIALLLIFFRCCRHHHHHQRFQIHWWQNQWRPFHRRGASQDLFAQRIQCFFHR